MEETAIMINLIYVVATTAVIFFAVILATAKSKQNNKASRYTAIAAAIASLGGLIIYGYTYATQLQDNIVLAVFFTLLSTVKMFMGSDGHETVFKLEIMQRSEFVLLFWVVHLIAIYSTASAVLATVGAPFLKQVRMYLYKRKKKLNIIFGINEHAIDFASVLSKDEESALIIIDENLDSLYSAAINELGCLYYVGNDATHSEAGFVKKLGITNKTDICVYALHTNEAKNLNYVYRLRDAFKKLSVSHKCTSLTLMANMEMSFGSDLQNSQDKYGFGSVLVLDRAYLTAHMLMKEYPPCNYVKFDTANAKALDGEIFSSAIIGFGKIGQAVLKNIVINGQFEGCGFKTTVFDPDLNAVSGYVIKNHSSMLEEYDIDLRKENAQESSFFDYLESNSKELDYIVVCTGNEDRNSEIAGEIQSTIKRLKGHAQVFQCSYDNIIHQCHDDDGEYTLKMTELYTLDNLNISIADSRAMELNHIYCGGKSAIEDWNNARFIDRMSSRASANFSNAYLKMTGFSEEDVIKGNKWDTLTDIQKLNLSKTEHLRWCAFFYSLGYKRMSDEDFEAKCAAYKNEKAIKGSSKIKIQKDDDKLLHICLVPWDDLDELTEKYREVTGDKNKDYKLDDTNNVMLLPKIIERNSRQ